MKLVIFEMRDIGANQKLVAALFNLKMLVDTWKFSVWTFISKILTMSILKKDNRTWLCNVSELEQKITGGSMQNEIDQKHSTSSMLNRRASYPEQKYNVRKSQSRIPIELFAKCWTD